MSYRFAARVLAAALGLWSMVGGLWLVAAWEQETSLREELAAERFWHMARGLWAPQALESLRSRRCSQHCLDEALATPGLVAIRVYDGRGREVFAGRGPTLAAGSPSPRLDVWAPLHEPGRRPPAQAGLKRIGMAQLLYSVERGIVGIRLLDRSGRTLAEPVAWPAKDDLPDEGVRVLDAPLYVGKFKPASPSRMGFVRLSYSGAQGFSSASVLDSRRRPVSRAEAAPAVPAASAALRSLRVPLASSGYQSGRLELEYAVDRPRLGWGAPAAAAIAGLVGGLLVLFVLLRPFAERLENLRRVVHSMAVGQGPKPEEAAAVEWESLEAALESLRSSLQKRQVGVSTEAERLRELVGRVRREKHRFAQALEYERHFHKEFLTALARELRGFRSALSAIGPRFEDARVSADIAQNSTVLLSIIRDVEGLAGVAPPPESPDVSAGELAKDWEAEFGPRARARGARLEVHVEPEAEGLKVERWSAQRLLKALAEETLARSPDRVRLDVSRSDKFAEFRLVVHAPQSKPGWEDGYASELAAAVGGALETESEAGASVRRLRLPCR